MVLLFYRDTKLIPPARGHRFAMFRVQDGDFRPCPSSHLLRTVEQAAIPALRRVSPCNVNDKCHVMLIRVRCQDTGTPPQEEWRERHVCADCCPPGLCAKKSIEEVIVQFDATTQRSIHSSIDVKGEVSLGGM